jgi:biuret amidohydrolase
MLVEAEPYKCSLNLPTAVLLIIDMQRDFLEPGGFGEMLGNDVSQLRRTIELNKTLPGAWRNVGGLVIHTCEGYRPDPADLPPAKEAPRRPVTVSRPSVC